MKILLFRGLFGHTSNLAQYRQICIILFYLHFLPPRPINATRSKCCSWLVKCSVLCPMLICIKLELLKFKQATNTVDFWHQIIYLPILEHNVLNQLTKNVHSATFIISSEVQVFYKKKTILFKSWHEQWTLWVQIQRNN